MKVVQKIMIWINLTLISLMYIRPVYAEGAGEEQILQWDLEIKNIWWQPNPSGGKTPWDMAGDVIRPLIAGMTGILSIAMIGIFVFKAVALAKSGDNPAERQKAIQGITYSLAGFALMGAATSIILIFENLLK